MDKIKFITDYVEGYIEPIKFKDEIYNEPSYEKFFEDSNPIPPYTSNVYGIYLYLLEKNYNCMEDVINTKSLLSEYLFFRGVKHKLDTNILDKFNLISKIQPKWLYLQPDYINKLFSEAGNLNGKELTNWLKETILKRFIYTSVPPKWLQAPNWLIEDEPLIFIGQLDITKISHDNSQMYIFYSKLKNEFRIVTQSE